MRKGSWKIAELGDKVEEVQGERDDLNSTVARLEEEVQNQLKMDKANTALVGQLHGDLDHTAREGRS